MLELLNNKEINEIKNYISFMNGEDNKDLSKSLLLTTPDEYTYKGIIEFVIDKTKAKVIEVNIDNLKKKIKLSKNKVTIILIDGLTSMLNYLDLLGFVRYHKSLLDKVNKVSNAFIVIPFDKESDPSDSITRIIEELPSKRIDVDYPNKDIINKILNERKSTFKELNQVDIEDISECLLNHSLSLINETIYKVELDYKNEKINELNYKVFYSYLMKLEHQCALDNDLTLKDKKIIAYHEIGHFISDYTLNKKLGTIAIGGYGDNLGHYQRTDENKNKVYSFNDLKNEIIVNLSGIACTNRLLNDHYSGGEDDIKKSRMLYKRISECALLGFDNLPPLFENQVQSFDERYYIKEEKFLNECLLEAYKIIDDNKYKINEIYTELIKTDILFKKDLSKIMLNA